MPTKSTIELTDLLLHTDIGTYGPTDVVPDAHILDLTLGIDPRHVLIAKDGMAQVFDYDPLVADIDRLARDGHYHTQEWLMTRIVGACAAYAEIETVSICLRKTPVIGKSGELGVRVSLDADALNSFRTTQMT